MEVAKEKGSSSWLAALPIESHGFSLHKGSFMMPSSRDMFGSHLSSTTHWTAQQVFSDCLPQWDLRSLSRTHVRSVPWYVCGTCPASPSLSGEQLYHMPLPTGRIFIIISSPALALLLCSPVGFIVLVSLKLEGDVESLPHWKLVKCQQCAC